MKDAITESGEGLTPTQVIANANTSINNTKSNEESFVYSIVAGSDVGTEPGSICVRATGKDKATTVKDKFVAGGYDFSARKPNVRSKCFDNRSIGKRSSLHHPCNTRRLWHSLNKEHHKAAILAAFLSIRKQIMHKSKNQGLTITELLITTVLIGILSSISLPSYFRQLQKTKQGESRQHPHIPLHFRDELRG